MDNDPLSTIFLDLNNLLVSFSGGKTSAYMAKLLLDSYDYNFKFVFANTGLESEETLDFIDKCDMAFDLNLVWLEAVVNPAHGKGITHKHIDYSSASRDGTPFEQFIAKSGIPNRNKPQCSDRLKASVIESYKKEIGWKGCLHAIGIRSDESKRKSKNSALVYNICYPLCDWLPADKQDVESFWEEQDFTLELEDHEGNCQTCWKKSDKKLFLLALEHPERFEFMRSMEANYSSVKPNSNGVPRVFFRGNRSVDDLISAAQEFTPSTLRNMIGASRDNNSGCSESCEAYS